MWPAPPPTTPGYAWREGEAARRRRRAADDALAHEITMLHLASRRTYGVPRIHAELRRLGRRVNRKRIARVMREHDIRGVTRRKHRSLTRPDKKGTPAPDLIGRDVHADTPGTRLVGDITYPPTAEGWLYLACWLDLATREVVGYAMADHHRAELVRATARAEVFAFIETFYNRRRLRKHKVFGYLTPAETRQRHQHALAA
ncbi:IS3 family transposase [Streptomyces sp. NPDC058459]|uniref:IS3 family transposase n=1 Tax=Streptomyces sp. NPDC058459 TaxID=3346508 RepID=UPI003665E78F